jgi:hypothetical protein
VILREVFESRTPRGGPSPQLRTPGTQTQDDDGDHQASKREASSRQPHGRGSKGELVRFGYGPGNRRSALRANRQRRRRSRQERTSIAIISTITAQRKMTVTARIANIGRIVTVLWKYGCDRALEFGNPINTASAATTTINVRILKRTRGIVRQSVAGLSQAPACSCSRSVD